MACPETGSRSTLSYIPEVTWGTTPAGSFTQIPYTTHSLILSKETLAGNDMSLMEQVERHGNKQVGGDIVADLRDDLFDAFLESVFYNAWDASPTSLPDILTIGTTQKAFTFEDAGNTVDVYRLYTGCVMNSLNVSMAPNQMVTATFGVLGKDSTTSGTGKTVTPYDATKAPFDAYSGSLLLGNSGATGTATEITSVDFTIDNQIEPSFIVGTDVAECLPRGKVSVSGSFTVLLTGTATIDRFINETESGLEIPVNDPTGSNEYTFGFPRIKINSADTVVDSPGQRVVSVNFTALEDSTDNTSAWVKRPDST